MWRDRGENMEKLNVLYEDNQIVVVLKPQNVPTQSDNSKDIDMLTMVKAYIKEKYNKPGEAYIGLVHRLDRPTGGIMVFARNSKSAKRLSEEFASHDVEKVYYAVTTKIVREKNKTLINYLEKNEKENIVKVVPMLTSGAKKAELNYKELENDGEMSLLEVRILTGRSHQIRVQLSSYGYPLYGDAKYGKNKNMSSKNLGLWAGKLSFTHPTTKDKMVFMACPDTSKEPWKRFKMDKYFVR